jgi:tRNA-dihydrouridine synthase A
MAMATNDEEKELHIAPMLDVSYREFRYFMRLFTKKATLWTEMVVDETLIYCSDIDDHLGFDDCEHPIVCQIGGNNPEWIYEATLLVKKYGYDSVDLNCECPSSRVASQKEFGAALMRKPHIAQAVVDSMRRVDIPVSVKVRIGVDELDSFDYICDFVRSLNCKRFILHARKVYTKGLNPAQNRRIPPLNYQTVYKLCEAFPDCTFWINGGIHSLVHAKNILLGNCTLSHTEIPCQLCQAPFGSCIAPPVVAPPNLRGVMLGRAAMDNPCMFWDVDRYFYQQPNPALTRRDVLDQYCAYLERIYPRRCCDEDDRKTNRFPGISAERYREACHVCQEIYGSSDQEEEEKEVEEDCNTTIKITFNVIQRSLKPVLGMFFNVRGSKTFRRACDTLTKDERIRNCGPGYVLRVASKTMEHVLDDPFVPAEDVV